jgi:hypothetical protein
MADGRDGGWQGWRMTGMVNDRDGEWLMVNIGNDWDGVLEGEFDKEYYLRLRAFLKAEYRSRVIYPSMYDIFNALKYTRTRTSKW